MAKSTKQNKTGPHNEGRGREVSILATGMVLEFCTWEIINNTTMNNKISILSYLNSDI